MIDEINYRVVRGLLGARANTEVQQADINLDSLTPVNQSTGASHPLMRGNTSS